MRAWFMGRNAREKFLLLGFALAAAAIWGSDVYDRLMTVRRETLLTSGQLTEQQAWLNKKTEIGNAARDAVADLDSSRTFNRVRLAAEISRIANETGLAPNLGSDAQDTEQTAQFAVHAVQVKLTHAPWDSLLRFYDELSKRAPYISIETFSLTPDRGNGDQLTAQMLVSSVEITKP